MSARKKSTRKKAACIPEFDGIKIDLLDSYALIYVGYQMVLKEEDEHGYASVLLHHGVNLLKEASFHLDEANSKLRDFCQDAGIEQDGGAL